MALLADLSRKLVNMLANGQAPAQAHAMQAGFSAPQSRPVPSLPQGMLPRPQRPSRLSPTDISSGPDSIRKYLEMLRRFDPSRASALAKHLGLSGSEKGDGVAGLQRPNDTF